VKLFETFSTKDFLKQGGADKATQARNQDPIVKGKLAPMTTQIYEKTFTLCS